VVGEITALNIYEHPVVVTAKAVLLVTEEVQNNTALADKIKTAFDAYDPSKNPDPFKYASEHMGTDVKATMFIVRGRFSIQKIGNPTVHHEQNERLKAFYRGVGKDTVYEPKRKSLDQLFGEPENSLELSEPTEEDMGRVPKPYVDPAHERELPENATAAQEDNALQDIIDANKLGFHGCEANRKTYRRIAAVFGWPEFRIVWMDVKIKVGCFWVIFTLPVPQIRFSSLVLFAYVAHEGNLAPYIQQSVEVCIVQSAVSSFVIGVVLNNFAAAMAAYEALFDACISNKALCLIPGLALIVESSE